jgi:hypothetical protein
VADKSDFLIVSKKEQEKILGALTKAKEVIDEAVALVGGEAAAKKPRKPRTPKETPAETETPKEETKTEAPVKTPVAKTTAPVAVKKFPAIPKKK